MFKRIAQNASWLFLAEIINKIVFFCITITIARVFGNEMYGKFSYALSFVTIFSVIADFGVNNLIIREIARDPLQAPKLLGNSIVIKIGLALITALALFVSTLLPMHSGDSTIKLFIGILTFFIIFNSYNTLAKSIYRSFEKMKFEAFVKALESIVLIAYLSITVLVFKNIYLSVAGFAIASCISFLFSIRWIKKFFTTFHIKLDKTIFWFLLKESWPFAIANIFVVLYFNLDTLMIKWILGDAEAGWYSVAYNFVFAFALLPSLISGSFYPALSKGYEKFHELQKKITLYMIALVSIGAVIALLTYLLAPFIINVVYGEEYKNSIATLQILAFVLPPLFLSNFLGTILSSINKQLTNTIIVVFTVFINIVLNYYFIRLYGQTGAAYASLITVCCMTISLLVPYFIFIRKQSDVHSTLR